MDLMLDFLLRLFVAGAMGAIIGLEREYSCLLYTSPSPRD